jgi:hypothetical protein
MLSAHSGENLVFNLFMGVNGIRTVIASPLESDAAISESYYFRN